MRRVRGVDATAAFWCSCGAIACGDAVAVENIHDTHAQVCPHNFIEEPEPRPSSTSELFQMWQVLRENKDAAGSTPSTASAGTTSGQGAGGDESDRAHSHPAPEPEQCRAVTVGLLGSTLRCRRIADHPGDHIDATGTKWHVSRPPSDAKAEAP